MREKINNFDKNVLNNSKHNRRKKTNKETEQLSTLNTNQKSKANPGNSFEFKIDLQ
jgi:hypothetical protein